MVKMETAKINEWFPARITPENAIKNETKDRVRLGARTNNSVQTDGTEKYVEDVSCLRMNFCKNYQWCGH